MTLYRVDDRRVRVDVDRNGDEKAWQDACIRVLSEAKVPLGWTGNKRNGGVRSTIADVTEHIQESISVKVSPGQKVILELTWDGKTTFTQPIDVDVPAKVH